jgi:hypothetical protein
MPEAKW